MSRIRCAAVLTLAVVSAGCINSATLVRVKPDGSGTIEQTMLVNMQAIKGLMAGMGGGGEIKTGGGMLNEAEFKRSAERMGVRPVSLTPLKEGGFEGAKAVFAFDDITKIRVDQDPQMAGSTSGSFSAGPKSRNPIRFELARRGATSTLTIAVNEDAVSAPAAGAAAGKPDVTMPSADAIDPAMLQMVKTMFQGFKVAIDLEVDGEIVKTNADHVAGSRVTLLELDLAGLFEDEAKFKALQGKVGPGMSLADLRPYLKDLKGVKINQPTVTIEFR